MFSGVNLIKKIIKLPIYVNVHYSTFKPEVNYERSFTHFIRFARLTNEVDKTNETKKKIPKSGDQSITQLNGSLAAPLI